MISFDPKAKPVCTSPSIQAYFASRVNLFQVHFEKKNFGERDLGLFGFYFSNKDITKVSMMNYYYYFINEILMPKLREGNHRIKKSW